MPSTDVVAPTAGLVVQVNVTEGQSVQAGEAVVVVQSMKTEISITTDVAGKVNKVHVKKDDEVNIGQVLVEIES
ncbi:MAG: biotin/lipoyl-binding protein [Thaumarchaeota archaeon]|nr:biotin/lipoyl-binding protein [Nitrososphaerota archaeon]